MTVAAEPTVEIRPSRRRRIMKIVLWLVGIVLFWLVLQLLGVDVRGWLEQLWDEVKWIPVGYLLAALILETARPSSPGSRTTGSSRRPTRAASRSGRSSRPTAVGVAMNGFLPANLGTFVTLLMFVAVIPGCTFAGSIAAYLVQKIFLHSGGDLRVPVHVPERPGIVRHQLRERDLAPGADGGDRRRRARDDRPPRPHLLARGEEALGQGQAGRRHPVAAPPVSDPGRSCRPSSAGSAAGS